MQIMLVLLAAGSSRRFQGNKLFSEFDGKPLYRHLADRVRKLPSNLFAGKMVVTQYEEIAHVLEEDGFLIVKNEAPELGIAHSIHLAVQAVLDIWKPDGDCGKGSSAICFSVCDQPFLRGETIERLICDWKKSGKGLGVLSCEGEQGNPAVFSEIYFSELLELTGDVGGRKVIRRHPEDLFVLTIEDPKELKDIDTREDLSSAARQEDGRER